jgi:hypothetical protein
MLCLEQEIKRESGEDPEQSRCCKFYKNVVGKNSTPLNKIVREGAYQRKQVRKPAMPVFQSLSRTKL